MKPLRHLPAVLCGKVSLCTAMPKETGYAPPSWGHLQKVLEILLHDTCVQCPRYSRVPQVYQCGLVGILFTCGFESSSSCSSSGPLGALSGWLLNPFDVPTIIVGFGVQGEHSLVFWHHRELQAYGGMSCSSPEAAISPRSRLPSPGAGVRDQGWVLGVPIAIGVSSLPGPLS